MHAPYTQLNLHCVWATWDRLPLITPEIQRAVYTAIMAKCKELNCEVVTIGGVSDHVHLLVRVHPTVAVSDLVKGVKGSSSHLVTHEIAPGEFFKWQGSYGAFSVDKRSVDIVRSCIDNQKLHHSQQDMEIDWEQAEEKIA